MNYLKILPVAYQRMDIMAINQEFKAALQAGQLAEALKLAMALAVELKITTSVVDSQKPKQSISTRINLVEGAIDNLLSEEFVANGSYQALQDFHFAQVSDVNQTIQNNLDTLGKMFRLMATLQQQHGFKVKPQTITVETQVLPRTEVVAEPALGYTNFVDVDTQVAPENLAPKTEPILPETTWQTEEETIIPEVLSAEDLDIETFEVQDIAPKGDYDDWGDLLDNFEDEENQNDTLPKNDDDF